MTCDIAPTLAERFCADDAMMEDAPYFGRSVWEEGQPAMIEFPDGSRAVIGPTGLWRPTQARK